MDSRLEPLGITTPQYNLMSAVEAQAGISNAAMAREAFVTAQSMLGIVANPVQGWLSIKEASPGS